MLQNRLSRIRWEPMAGRFSFSVPGRRNSGDPWFRIGTAHDVTVQELRVECFCPADDDTAALAAILSS